MYGPPGDQILVNTWSTTTYGTSYIDVMTRDGCIPISKENKGGLIDSKGKSDVSFKPAHRIPFDASDGLIFVKK